MLQIYHPHQGWQQAQSSLPAQGWLKLINPSKEAIHQVSRHYQIASELIEAALDPNARPRLHSQEGAHLVLSHLPLAQPDSERVPFGILPVGIILKDQLVLTVCLQDSPIWQTKMAQGLATLDERPLQSVYRLLAASTNAFLDALKRIEHRVTAVEQALQKSIKNRQVFKLLNHNKSLIAFATSLHSMVQVLNRLHAQPPVPADQHDQDLLLDIKVATAQAQAIAAIHSANLRNLMDAYSAAIENNLSLVVQHLSIYVIIMAVPMGIAGLYGMNTPLPLQDEPYILALLVVISLVVVGLITRAFKARRII
ncbi:MAG: magnesium transporter CorA family protein [Neisseriaceae bacterium]|nr:magnesium transporter CorA family protein [Neisseriaceae bacterium]